MALRGRVEKMEPAYVIEYENGVLRVRFGRPAQNDEIVREAAAHLEKLIKGGVLTGGEIIRINGPASLPVAMTIAHAVSHLYSSVACYDPKLGKYVICISHSPKYKLGDLID